MGSLSAVTGTDNSIASQTAFGAGATCAVCVPSDYSGTAAQDAGACLGAAWPQGCTTKQDDCLTFCQTGYSYLCPDTCLARDQARFEATAWFGADYSKNNLAIKTGNLFGATGLTCEESENTADANKQIRFPSCRNPDHLTTVMCPESCNKMFELSDCAGKTAPVAAAGEGFIGDVRPADFDPNLPGNCEAWANHCSLQNGGLPGGSQRMILACPPLVDQSSWTFNEGEKCEVGGYLGGEPAFQFYPKSEMDAIRAACPGACGVCHDPTISDDDGDNPCFGREMHACLVTDQALSAPTAYANCFSDGAGTGAVRVPLIELRAGDLVLDSATSMSRVIVNEHVQSPHKSALLTMATADGELVVTPDHYIAAGGGEFVAAGKAQVLVGAAGEAVAIEHTSVKMGEVVNPITVSGKLLVATATGAPLLATTYGGWIAETALRYGGILTGVSLSNGLSSVFPTSAQAYHDAVIEPIAPSKAAFSLWSQLFTATPTVVHPIAFMVVDIIVAAGFVAWSMCSVGGAGLAAAAVFNEYILLK